MNTTTIWATYYLVFGNWGTPAIQGSLRRRDNHTHCKALFDIRRRNDIQRYCSLHFVS